MRHPTLFRSFLGLCLGLALASSSSHAALNRWSSGGPVAGGTVLALAFDPFDPAIVYAGTSGGVFRSEDHGATWTARSFGLARADVKELAADPVTPGIVYALTDRGVQKSLDRGLSWQPSTLSGFVDALALDPSDPDTLYTSTQGTIQKSSNGGASWFPGQKLGSRVSAIEVAPSASGVVYAATDAGLFRSPDGGSSWNPAGTIDAEFLVSLAVDTANAQVLYVGTEHGVFKSADGGASWSRHGLDGQVVEEIEIDPTSPSKLFALAHGVYRSTNGGLTWTLLDDRFFNCRALAGDPSSSTWLVGSPDGVFRSVNDGAVWVSSSTGITASDVDHLTVDPHRPGVLYATVYENLYKSRDAGATWSLLPGFSRITALAIDPKTPSVVYAGTSTGLWRSLDAGSSWSLINAAEINAHQLAIDPANPSTMYLTRFREGVRKSVDGGFHWSPAGPDVADLSPLVLQIAPSNPRTLYIAASFPDGVFKSADGGESWTEIGGGLPTQEIRTLAVDPHDADVVYIAPHSERLYKSTDGGASWFPSGNGLFFSNVDGIAVDPSDSSRLYVSNLGIGIFRSTNGGASWTLFSEGMLDALEVSDIVIDPVNPFLLYAETFGGGVQARADLPPASSLRLNGNRFLVKMSWETAPGVSGRGQTQTLTADTGYAWFFQESNVEVLLKVLDGCGINSRFWVFAAGLTDVRTDITVGDTLTGAVRIYHNPPGQPFQPIQDTTAFACSTTGLAATKALSSTSGPILLRNGRFRVTAEFAPGATPLPAEGAKLTDDSAYLWFFDQNNVEAFLKVVDGCPVNGRFWVFAAGLTNVEMRITVEDTQTGAVKVYENPGGTAFRPIQDTSAFLGCG